MNNIEIEKKFLICFPDEDFLKSLPNCSCTEIEQIYLQKSDDGFSKRIRKRGKGNDFLYYYTQKKHITNMRRVEEEKLITEQEYNDLKGNADPNLKTIYKKRYCIPYEGHTLEIDVFPFWKNQAYLEIELESESEKYSIPEYLHILKDITEDGRYTNRALSKEIPNE